MPLIPKPFGLLTGSILCSNPTDNQLFTFPVGKAGEKGRREVSGKEYRIEKRREGSKEAKMG